MFWVAVDKFGYSAIYFCSTIILARLLTPKDYGVLGMVAIFISISQMIVESGLGGALVKKANPDHKDFSTIFTFNLVISISLYSILFFASDYIAVYYKDPLFAKVIKVSALTIVINAFTLTQRVHLLRELKFKRQSVISVTSFLLATSVGIGMAYKGYGVWALIFQQVLYSLIYSIQMFIAVKYLPSFLFSKASFRSLFAFGGRLFMSSMLQVIYDNIFALIIGKMYSVSLTGLYYQSKKLVDFPVSIFRALIDGAAFPILAKIQGEEEFGKMSSRITRGVIALAFPLTLAVPIFSRQIILIVLGEKWMAAVPILSVLSVGALFLVLDSVTRNVIKSSGRVDLLLRYEVIKKIIAVLVILITINISLQALMWGIVIINFISLVINVLVINSISSYSLKKQLSDFTPFLMMAGGSCLFIFLIGPIIKTSVLLDVLVRGGVLVAVYISMGLVFKITEIFVLRNKCLQYIQRVK